MARIRRADTAPGCGAGEYEHCTCPPADEMDYLIWWRNAVDSGVLDVGELDAGTMEVERAA